MSAETHPESLPRSVLEQSRAVICALDAGLRITYCNPAWDRFALENQGQGVLAQGVAGNALLEVVADPLKAFYQQIFERARRTGQVQEFDYECSSAETFRQFHMQIMPLRHEQGGFLVIHSLRVEKPHDHRIALPSEDERYVGPGGLIVMCCHCRRTRRVQQPEVWDWVPGYLSRHHANVSHGLCPLCYAYFYPSLYEKSEAAKAPLPR